MINKPGDTIDFYLSPARNTQAAKRFLGKALKSMRSWAQLRAINIDKASPHNTVIIELKAAGKCLPDTVHRQVKYLNNMIGAGHGKLKRLINFVRGFKSMKIAYATIKDFELISIFKKGQMGTWKYGRGLIGRICLIEKQFGIYSE